MFNIHLNEKTLRGAAYGIYEKIKNLSQKKYHELNDVKVISNYNSKELSSYLKQVMTSQGGFFLGRLGGSDYEVVNRYYNNNKIYNNYRRYSKDLNIVKNFNGYFDFDDNSSNFIKYIDILINSYKNSDCFSYCNKNIIDQFNRSNYLSSYYNFMNEILTKKIAFDYAFFETVYPFLNSFKIWGSGKKILFISPFSESIEFQFKRKNNLINNYEFPDFSLLTYNTKITYNNKNDIKNNSYITTDNWHQECNVVKNAISNIDFDIAFLSCGSYAMPIGSFIKSNLNKKSIYLGGILNVMFNIYGQRYDSPYFNNIVNMDYQIEPFENKLITNIHGGRQAKSESLNAYFGEKR